MCACVVSYENIRTSEPDVFKLGGHTYVTGTLGTSQRHVKCDDINKMIASSHGIISSRYEGEGEQVES